VILRAVDQCFGSGFVFLRIRILEFFPSPDPGKKLLFSKAIAKFWDKFLFSTQEVGILFVLSTNQVGILLDRELLLGIIFKNK